MDLLKAIQDSGLGVWIRESSWALFAALIVHTISMGFVVGTGLAIDARLLGVARGVPLAALRRLLAVAGWALPFVVLSGLVLVIGYPAKALTNPLFYAKLAALAVALALTWRMVREPPSWARLGALLSMPLWVLGVAGGRFLAYTHKILLVY
ncbi:hypothetical protein [Phenylobacterium sp.]|uniref:hypothetical protein n=1 Tax=Phenylobacterium sp. TaxID=1871053 RepID=UPI002F93097F